VALNLYRRHCQACQAGRKEDSRSGEFEERRKGWRRCDCVIFASGTLNGKFKRKSTELTDWAKATELASTWKSWEGELPQPLPEPVQPAEPEKVTIEKAIAEFLKDHEGESADSTVRMYRYFLNDFAAFSAMKGYILIEQWGPEDVREFRKSWTVTKETGTESVAPGTKTKNMANLKAFFEFCLVNEWINRNPARLLKKSRNRKDTEKESEEKIPFSDEEVTRMFEACETKYGKNKYATRYRTTGRDLADFISISVYTGLRISDVATFNVNRVLENGDCHIRTTKRGKKVYTWIPTWLLERIRERARQFGPLIFGSHDTENMDTITDQWRRKLKRLWELCGPWPEPPTHHRFRHTFARILLQRPGVSVRDVAELLGNTEEVVRKHYAAWVPERQARLTKVLKDAFEDKPTPHAIPFAARR
jgi:integrase